MDGVGVDKGNLEAEEADAGDRIDQLRACGGKIGEGSAEINDLVRDMMDAGATLREEAPDRSVLTEGGEQFDPARAEKHRSGLDALFGDDVTMFERPAKQSRVRCDGVLEVGHGHAKMVDAGWLHTADGTSRRVAERSC